MSLKSLLEISHKALTASHINHALIGGLALALWGLQRATADVDYLADEKQREAIKKAMIENGFTLIFESSDVLQFSGIGSVDFILARRPMSLQMLEDAKMIPNSSIRFLLAEDLIGLKLQAYKNDPSRELQDKADIQNLFRKNKNLDKERIKKYADIFGEWEVIEKLWKT